VGPKGSGSWERISWDEALGEVAAQMLRIRAAYGPAAILDCSRSGNTAVLHNRAAIQRLLHLFGGCTELWSNLSNEAEIFALRHTYGPKADCKFSGREPGDYVNSRLMILWGWSPADGTFGTNNPHTCTGRTSAASASSPSIRVPRGRASRCPTSTWRSARARTPPCSSRWRRSS
jgi:anaerobic dimethyl sulfoxide reductase subunit A